MRRSGITGPAAVFFLLSHRRAQEDPRVIARPDPDPRHARADPEPAAGPGRPWRLIAGGTGRVAPDPVLVDAALRLLVDQCEQGLAVVDRFARAHYLNRAARAIVDRGLLRLEHGCLRGPTAEDGAALRRLFAAGGGSVRLDRAGGTLLIAASAIPAAHDPAGGAALLLRLIDPAAAPRPDPGTLRDQFGFTPAEAALAVDILAGMDLAASARRRGITRNTARAHLRHLFGKTGTRRQAELMRLLLLCPQPIAAKPGSEIYPRGSLDRPNGGCEYLAIKRS
jgi:DNA-binding CsgD family transcriptional regulator